MKVRSAGKTHVGLKRKLNEDSLVIAPDLGLYVVADGMGGHRAGEVASRMAVETMADYWKKVRNDEPPSLLEPIDQDISEEAKHLINSISLSNIIVHEAQKKPKYLRMGSTISALLVEEECIWAADVGDSPIYLLDQGEMRQVSEEHSIEAEQRSLGLFDPLDSTNPMVKNMLTRVLGLNERVDVFITRLNPKVGNLIMVCSDGLTNYVSEQSIKTVLDDFSMSLERRADILIDEANRGGGEDNITVVLLEILEEGKWKKFKKKLKL